MSIIGGPCWRFVGSPACQSHFCTIFSSTALSLASPSAPSSNRSPQGSILPSCSSTSPVRWLASQLQQLSLLLRCQFVLDSHQQCHLFPLDLSLRRQHFFQLRQNLLLVRARLLDQRNHLLHLILQFPLPLREFQLRLADFRLQIVFLLGAQPDRLLMLHHQFRSKEALPDRILFG